MIKKGESESKDLFFVTTFPKDKDSEILAYDLATPIDIIIEDSTTHSGIDLKPEYAEEVVETVEMGKGLLARGFKFAITLPEPVGGGLNFEVPPKSVIKTSRKIIYRSPKKK